MSILTDYQRDQRLILDTLRRSEEGMERVVAQLAEVHLRLIEIGTERRRDAQDLQTLRGSVDLITNSLQSAIVRITKLEEKESARAKGEADVVVQGRWDKLTNVLTGLAGGGAAAGLIKALSLFGG